MKVYAIYKKDDKSLYAWSDKRELASTFLRQRNKSKFKLKTLHFEDPEYNQFEIKCKERLLTSIPVNFREKDFLLAGTYAEDKELSAACDDLLEETEFNYIKLDHHIRETQTLTKKEIDAIQTLSACWTDGDKGPDDYCKFLLNSWYLFYKLFHYTF